MVEARVTSTTDFRVVSMSWSRECFPFPLHSVPPPQGAAYSPEQAKEYASKMLGAKLITKQTGAAGRVCNAVRCYATVICLAPRH